MFRSGNRTLKYSEILIAISGAILGLFIQPVLASLFEPLFDTTTKALLAGFVLMSLIIIIALSGIVALARSHDKQLERVEIDLHETRNHVKLSTSLLKIGISGANTSHTETLFEEFCAGAENEILILQTYLGSVRQLPDSLFEACKRGVKVRLLILDPDGDLIKQRLNDIGLPNTINIHKDALERLQILIKRKNPSLDLLEIRLYDRIPPFALYNADRKIRMGFFWHGEHGNIGPHIIIDDKGSLLGTYAINTFENIWESSQRLELVSAPNKEMPGK